MGKNSSHKAMQAQRYSAGGEGGGAGGGEAAPSLPLSHQEADVTYHTAEWHAARIAALQSSRMTWEEFRKQQKELQAKEDAIVGSEKALREHRALLDAERAARLGARVAAGAEPPPKKRKRTSKSKERSKSKDKKKRKKSLKDKKSKKSKRSSKKKRRSRSSGSSSSDSGSSDSSTSSSSGDSSTSSGGGGGAAKAGKAEGPIKLSEYLRS